MTRPTPLPSQSPYLMAALLADVARMAAEQAEDQAEAARELAEATTHELIATFGAVAYALRVSDAPRPE